MTMLYTTNQAYPYPNVNETLNNANDWIYLLAQYAELRGIQRFASQAELSTKRPTPTAGEMAYLADTDIVQLYDGAAWKRVYPPSPIRLQRHRCALLRAGRSG